MLQPKVTMRNVQVCVRRSYMGGYRRAKVLLSFAEHSAVQTGSGLETNACGFENIKPKGAFQTCDVNSTPAANILKLSKKKASTYEQRSERDVK